jgi:homoserine kinase type II
MSTATDRRQAARAILGGMAVFTEVGFPEAAALISHLGAGTLVSLTGISSGIENTNYFADTSQARLVVTVFERLDRSELMLHLSQRGLPVPGPLAAASGELVHTLAGKPAAVVPRLAGTPVREPNLAHCDQVATTLAQLHLAGRDYARTQPNPRGLEYWRDTASWLMQHLSPPECELLTAELAHQQSIAMSSMYAGLPRGAIHGDLFCDNVLFEGERLTGLVDFYFAATDTFVYDIAVCLNDWCTRADGALDVARAASFVAAYEAVRAFLPEERALLSELLRAAALRFWITRLVDIHRPRDARLLQPKDPTQYQRILQLRATTPWRA